MKTIIRILYLALLCFPLLLTGQSTDQNYVKSVKVRVEGMSDESGLNNQNSRSTVVYSNGFGTPMQTVQKGFSPNKKDFVSFKVLDVFGREPKVYSPYAEITGNDGSYKTDPIGSQESFYQGALKLAHTDYAYAPVAFENSPADRILKQGAPGFEWQFRSQDEHVVSFDFSPRNAG